MPNIPKWVGSTEIAEKEDSPAWDFGDQTKIQRVFEGPYAAILAARPAKGSMLDGWPSYYRVEHSTVRRQAGDKGVLTIDIGTIDDDDTPPEEKPDPVFEREWVEVTKPLEQHPRYTDLTLAHLSMVEKWLDEDDPALVADYKFKYKDTAGSDQVGQLPADPGIVREYAAKRRRGQDSYNVYAPVCRRTTYAVNSVPAATEAGSISTPPAGCSPPSGYTYVKTADRANRQGRFGSWERQEEWTGFDSVDEDLID